MITRAKLSSVVQGLPKYRSVLAGNEAFIPNNYESIATSTGGSSSITFSSIPQTYKHLQLRITAFSGQSYAPQIRINGETAGYYYNHSLETQYSGGTSSINSYSGSGTSMSLFNSIGLLPGGGSGYPTVGIFDIYDYTNSSKKPTLSGYSGSATNRTSYDWLMFCSGLFNYSSGAAVNSITIFLGGNTFTSGTSIALYGITG